MPDREFLESIAKDAAEMKSKLGNVEGQLSETNQIVKALMHRAEKLDAKYDGTATEESAERLEARKD